MMQEVSNFSAVGEHVHPLQQSELLSQQPPQLVVVTVNVSVDCCANCNSNFPVSIEADGRVRVQKVKEFMSLSTVTGELCNVSVWEALSLVFELKLRRQASNNPHFSVFPSFDHLMHDLQATELALCSKCAICLANLYKFYREFTELINSDSYVSKIINQDIVGFEHLSQPQTNTASLNVQSVSSSSTGNETANSRIDLGMAESCRLAMEVQNAMAYKPFAAAGCDGSDGTLKVEIHPPGLSIKNELQILGYENINMNSNHVNSFNPQMVNHFQVEQYSRSTSQGTSKFEPSSDGLKTMILGTGYPESEKRVGDSLKGERMNVRKDQQITVEMTQKQVINSNSTVQKKNEDVQHQRKKCKLTLLCPQCGKIRHSEAGLTTHINAKHNNLKPFACLICGKMFGYKTQAHAHMIRHKSELSNFCNICDRGFRTAGECEQHKSTHPKPVKFTCSTCRTVFDDLREMNRHVIELHKNVKPFPCHICGKLYTQKSHLNEHILKHSPFYCNICGKLFTTDALKYHTMKMHKDVNEEILLSSDIDTSDDSE